ncbi:lymphocyte antigen 75-like [Spodoptera litura]|uniref:Lymphocyte antigen 75-like n=1 Tax=Spodoptera litura TaxID=69820 RepID=A0A9J7DV65_SPOLT|nr:lymphocyte antigen 75-like [Spodoptera litura]
MSMTQIVLSLLLWAGVALCKQYVYDDDADGWLKLHKIPLTWQEAFMTCHLEDAVLASPTNDALHQAMLTAVKKAEIDLPIYIGTKEMFVYGQYASIEGVQLEDMPVKFPSTNGIKPEECVRLTKEGEVAFTNCSEWLPYICYKKNTTHLKYNYDCGTFDREYQYNAATGSCYKLHKQARTWRLAYKVCTAEGGHLVIINDKTEDDVVVNILKGKPRNLPWELSHAGFFDWNKDLLTFLTIHGEKLNTVYNIWNENQPDNKGVNIYGGILENGKLDEEWDSREAYFVCEKDPKIHLYDRQLCGCKWEGCTVGCF